MSNEKMFTECNNASANEAMRMDNSGRGPLQVPGFGGIPIEHVLKCEDRFAHGIADWQQVPAVTARELAMVAVMNNLTDKPEWHVNIFNNQIVANWREEAFATTPLMSEKAWSWCLNELRDKAVQFSENQYVRVLDTGSCICKSDALVPEYLGALFRSGVAPLVEQPGKDWQPKSDEQVLNLVDPSLFPLVYGRSLVLADKRQVDLENVLGFYEFAKVAPKHFDRRVDSLEVQRQIEQGASETWGINVDRNESNLDFYFWSSNYQCLPCEVEFLKGSGTEVHISSYVNNLHPTHKSLYRSVEKLISLAIKPWNDCLVQGQCGWKDIFNQGQRGPVPLRIITYGVEWENELPEWALSFNIPSSVRIERYLEAQELLRNTTENETREVRKRRLWAQDIIRGYGDVEGKLDMKKPIPELWRMAKEYLELPEKGSAIPTDLPEDWAEGERGPWSHILQKHKRLMYFKHPEPGTAFSYEEWKAGNSNKEIIDIVTEPPEIGNFIKPVIPDFKFYKVALQDTFRTQGLQIIVKIDSIELTPEKPTYSGGSWQLSGQMNEHIVAVAMYSYDVQNVTKTRISFRQETPLCDWYYRYATHRFAKEKYDYWHQPAHRYNKSTTEIPAIAEILGFREADISKETMPVRDFLPYQNIGSVTVPQGRLITFPNTMEHRVEPFKLVDPTLPGHHRTVKLYLVDPHYRVCSTRNVPPQQHDWYAQAVSDEFLKLGVPREISAEITGKTNDWPMGIEEAREHRLEMMKEHRWKDMARYSSEPLYAFW